MDQLNLSAWEGRTETARGVVSQPQAQMIHATLGHGSAPASGAALPALRHWCAFPVEAPMDQLGPDGHPKLGGFLPPVPLERRMWAAGRLRFHKPLHVDEPLTKSSTIKAVTEKTGGAGRMVFVTVAHEIAGADGLAITEEQDIVYLAIPDSFTPPKKTPMPASPVLSETVSVTAPLLFRYSAVTFNAHRIHYDRAYTTEVEHYPGLVVHGPLQATLLVDAATRHRGGPPTTFTFRGVHPLFDHEDLHLMAEEDDTGVLALCAGSSGGHRTMQATATWEET